MKDQDKPTEPEAMNKTQLAALYKVCPRTFQKWIDKHIDEIGKLSGTNIYTPAQVKIIYEKIGEP